MKELSIRISDYFNFLWDASRSVIDGYFFKRYPEIGTYVHPNGAASTLLVASHYAVLRQRDELFGTDGEFDEYVKDAAEIDKCVESYINRGGGANGLPTDLYKRLVQSMEASVIPDAMWLLSDMGDGGKKGRVVAIHAQIGNYIANSFFRKRGASVIELGDASNVISRLFAVCYTKYAETLGFNEEDYDETLQLQEENNRPWERPVIDSISCPEHPFVSSLVEHITSDELRSYGHEPPKVGSPIYWAMEYFDEYFQRMNAHVPRLTEDDVYDFSESLYEYVLRYAPVVSKKHLDKRVDYVWAYGLRKGEMVIDILKETLGDEQFNAVENEILLMTNGFIERYLANNNYDEDIFNDDLHELNHGHFKVTRKKGENQMGVVSSPSEGSPIKRSTGHAFADRVCNRYDGIINYFANSPFGYNPGDLTILSLLPPIDRCLVLEQLFLKGYIDQRAIPVWIDKLSMAYWKVRAQVSYGTACWEHQAMEFLKSCQYGSKAGFLSEDERDYQEDKVLSLGIKNVCKTYGDTAKLLLEYAPASPTLVRLLSSLCLEHAGREVFAGVNLSTCEGFGDYVVFVNDRTDFLKQSTGRGGGNALMPHFRAAKDRYMSAFPNTYAPWFFGELSDYEKRISEGRPFSEAEGMAKLPSYVKEHAPCWLMA